MNIRFILRYYGKVLESEHQGITQGCLWQLFFFKTKELQNHSITLPGQEILHFLETVVFISFSKSTEVFGNCSFT